MTEFSINLILFGILTIATILVTIKIYKVLKDFFSEFTKDG